MTNMLNFEGVEYAPDGTHLFGPADFILARQKITAIIGPNGGGKSLFLSLCHGLIQPTKGNITWANGPVTSTRTSRGYIFQTPAIMRRSVADNIGFALMTSPLTKQQRQARVDELLALVQLTDKADQPAALLSGGEAQAMALARALASGPDVLIMDEPTSSLDPNATGMFETIADQLADSGMAIFWATHDLAQARRMAHYVILIADGKIAEHGPANYLLRSPKSDAAREFLEGRF